MTDYDVVIVGAGPAGFACAETLAKNNRKVLIVEQKQEIGPKVCAGGLLGHDLDYFKIPQELLDCKLNKVIVHSQHTTDVVELEHPFIYTIDRKNLGQWQLKKIKDAGVEVITGQRVVDIGDEHIFLSSGQIMNYKILIGADGSTSIVRKHLKLPIEKQIIGIQYMIPTDKYKDMEYFFDSVLFHSWYAWIFPHKGYAIIGTVCIPRVFPSEKLQKNFHEWLKQKDIDISNAKYQAFPINVDYRGHKFGNIYLVGDAAGFASDWSGEGIYQALVSGEEIAKQILDPNYKSEKLNEILEHKRLHDEILKMIEVSGVIRPLEYEMLLLLLKARFFGKEIIEKIG